MKIIAPWTLGRNYQLIEIRGVPNRGISHRSGDGTAAVPSARRWWGEIRRGRRVELQAMLADCVGAVTAEGQFVQEILHYFAIVREET